MTFVDPRDNAESWSPEIFDWAGPRVRDVVMINHDPRTSRVLDVGADQGKYRVLLSEFAHVDAVEVWGPSIRENQLDMLYDYVYNVDIVEFVGTRAFRDADYDVIIFGDVLEHIDRPSAQYVLETICATSHADVIVVVPFESHQHAEKDNPYQVHKQDDLTIELMETAYPNLRLIDVEFRDDRPFKGIYRRTPQW